MSGPLPIIERVALTIEQRLKAIRKADGFNYDVQGIIRPKRLWSTTDQKDKSILLVQGHAEIDEENSAEGSPRALAYVYHFALGLFVLPSDHDEAPADTQMNLFTADVLQAITLTPPGQFNPTNNWQQFLDGVGGGPLAIDSAFTGLMPLEDETGSYDGQTIGYAVTVRTPENDPYTFL